MLYTHLNYNFLPILISFFFSFFFATLCIFFFYHISYFLPFFLCFLIGNGFFLFYYYHTLLEFSFVQFFLNSQFFIFFVVSEVFFFVGVFWGLFWVIFSYDSTFILAITLISPFGLALFNTFLLLVSSSYAVIFHVNHLNLVKDSSLIWCFVFGFFFIINQVIEFYYCSFTISSFSLTSVFFFGTGFHGFHVFVGLVLILTNLVALYIYNSTLIFYLNCSLLYWHFVDVVWLFLFLFVYIVTFFLYI